MLTSTGAETPSASSIQSLLYFFAHEICILAFHRISSIGIRCPAYTGN